MANLRRLSTPDLQLLRGIILTVIEEGDVDGEEWDFYQWDRTLSDSERLASCTTERSAFCDAIQQRIFATESAPVKEGSTDGTQ